MSAAVQFDEPIKALREAKDRLLRPAIGFDHPRQVLRDPYLDPAAKRAVLSSWASDASAVENWPSLRWLFGTPRPVPVTEVLEALRQLDEDVPIQMPAKARAAPSGALTA